MSARRAAQTVLQAAQSGDQRALLVAMRDLIARTIEAGVSPRDLVGLSKRLLDLAQEVGALDTAAVPGHLSVVDDVWDGSAI